MYNEDLSVMSPSVMMGLFIVGLDFVLGRSHGFCES